jgi:hypothetical protein
MNQREGATQSTFSDWIVWMAVRQEPSRFLIRSVSSVHPVQSPTNKASAQAGSHVSLRIQERARWNAEWFKQKASNEKRDDERLNYCDPRHIGMAVARSSENDDSLHEEAYNDLTQDVFVSARPPPDILTNSRVFAG